MHNVIIYGNQFKFYSYSNRLITIYGGCTVQMVLLYEFWVENLYGRRHAVVVV